MDLSYSVRWNYVIYSQTSNLQPLKSGNGLVIFWSRAYLAMLELKVTQFSTSGTRMLIFQSLREMHRDTD